MTFTIVPYGDNQQVPSATGFSYIPDQLIAGGRNLVTQPIVLGAGTLQRGTVLGQQSSYTFTSAAKAGNVGTGTVGGITPGASIEYSPAPLPGYVLTATSATQFSVTDPEGNPVGTATAGTPFASAEINFTISAGGTAFVAGDGFVITAIPGTGTYVACVRTASDGSQVPSAILVDFADASAGPVRTGAYVAGEFNYDALTIDASWSMPVLVAALRLYGIFVKSSVIAADPS